MKNHGRNMLCFMVLLVAAGAAAQTAPALSYNRVMLYANTADMEDFEDDATGVGFEASVELGSMFHLWSSYGTSSVDARYQLEIYPPINAQMEVEAGAFALGGGIHHAVSDRASVFAEAGMVRTNGKTQTRFDGGSPVGFDDDDTGFQLAGGVRFQALPKVELRLLATLIDVGDSEDSAYGVAVASDSGAGVLDPSVIEIPSVVSFDDPADAGDSSSVVGTAAIEYSATDNLGVAGVLAFDDEGSGWGVGVVLRF